MIIQKLTPFQNVVSGVTCVQPNIQLGMTIYAIILRRGGTDFGNQHLNNIRIMLDSKRIWDIEGFDLLQQNQYLGYHWRNYINQHEHGALSQPPTAYSSNIDLIPFADLNSRTIDGESMGALDTSVGYRSFSMEIDIDAASVNPTLEAWALMGPPKGNTPNRMTFRSVMKRIEAPSASGEVNFQVPLGSRAGALIHKTYFHHTYMTKLQVLKDGLYLLQEGEDEILNYISGVTSRINVPGLLVFDPSNNNNQADSISTVRNDAINSPANFEFKGTVSQADSVKIYSSLYASIDRI